MKTKTIPFDLETAKKIQAGEIDGKIKTRSNKNVRVICWDRMDTETPIVFLVQYDDWEGLYKCTLTGEYSEGRIGDDERINKLVLEVPNNEPQFKPFDKVLCRDENDDMWKANLFSHKTSELSYPYYVCGGSFYKQCIPYEGNEDLVGTTKKPKED